MVEKMSNGRNVGGYVKTQSEMDDLEQRKVIALEKIASSLVKLVETTSRSIKQNGTVKESTNFFDKLFIV